MFHKHVSFLFFLGLQFSPATLASNIMNSLSKRRHQPSAKPAAASLVSSVPQVVQRKPSLRESTQKKSEQSKLDIEEKSKNSRKEAAAATRKQKNDSNKASMRAAIQQLAAKRAAKEATEEAAETPANQNAATASPKKRASSPTIEEKSRQSRVDEATKSRKKKQDSSMAARRKSTIVNLDGGDMFSDSWDWGDEEMDGDDEMVE